MVTHRSLCIAALFLLCTARVCMADDWNMAVAQPQFQAVSPLTAKSIDCRIALKKISVTYRLANDSNQPVSFRIKFSTPLYSWRGMSENNPDRSYSELALTINGEAAACSKITEAFLGEKNVTGILQKYGINPNIVADSRLFPGTTPELLKKYAELVDKELFDKEMLQYSVFSPNWSAKNSYAWTQDFPAGSEQSLAYAYEPLWGSALYGLSDSGLELVCPGFRWDDVEKHLGGGQNGEATYIAYWLTLPMDSTAWSGPIETLSITADIPDEEGAPHLLFLTYGDTTVTGLRQVRFTRSMLDGADAVTVLIMRKLS